MITWCLLLVTVINLHATRAMVNAAIPHISKIKHFEVIKDGSLKVEEVDSDRMSVFLQTKYQNFRFNLKRNTLLLHPEFRFIHGDMTMTHEKQTFENCHYQEDEDGGERLFAIFSTCGGGLSGLIISNDGEQYYIERIDRDNNTHAFFTVTDDQLMRIPVFKSSKNRQRRSEEALKYISVAVVVDMAFLSRYGNNVSMVTKNVIETINYVDWLYKKINTRCALLSLEIWNDTDRIQVTNDSSTVLDSFQKYNREKLLVKHNYAHDIAHFITGTRFKASVVGLAPIGIICTSQAASISIDRGSAPMTASTMAHEIGHVLGMYHDGNDCKCNAAYCVMSAITGSSVPASEFTTCNTDNYDALCNQGKCQCLQDIPTKLYGPSVCGNGFLEPGEECDCGSVQECTNRCCNATTCVFTSGSSCASGPCCQDCQLKQLGTICRSNKNECDLPEYCNGTSASCPEDVYKPDFTTCINTQALCYNGACTASVDKQCQVFWGDNARRADDICFQRNLRSATAGNCGTNDVGNFIPCNAEDIFCGALQCTGSDLPTFPIIGSSRRTSSGGYNINGVYYSCKSGTTYLADNIKDPHVILAATKCGDNKACYDKKCQNISSLQTQLVTPCAQLCRNGGVCNNKGYCSCTALYTGLQCEKDSLATIKPTISDQTKVNSNRTSNNSTLDSNESKTDVLIIVLPIVGGMFLIIISIILYKFHLKKISRKREMDSRNRNVEDNNNNNNLIIPKTENDSKRRGSNDSKRRGSNDSKRRGSNDSKRRGSNYIISDTPAVLTGHFRKFSKAYDNDISIYGDIPHEGQHGIHAVTISESNADVYSNNIINDTSKPDNNGKRKDSGHPTKTLTTETKTKDPILTTFKARKFKNEEENNADIQSDEKEGMETSPINESSRKEENFSEHTFFKLPSLDDRKGNLIADQETKLRWDTSMFQQLNNILDFPDIPATTVGTSKPETKTHEKVSETLSGISRLSAKLSIKKNRKVSKTIYPTDTVVHKR